ncbi:MAG: hypothetical protein ETSY1_35125 [Candidatus Entotheonella factor]|uniref:Uncharacterized protein n=1 Tax=Entotheonella factor TaxID=1429438 RepID=W4L8H0_ENTF1|nr:MAG: hypothetical protein ETSY1_35125 [Candidatus Entotheonella factor]
MDTSVLHRCRQAVEVHVRMRYSDLPPTEVVINCFPYH